MKVSELKDFMVVCSKIATGKGSAEKELKQYESMRSKLLQDKNLINFVPQFITSSPEGVDIYEYFQAMTRKYNERRETIRLSFQEMIERAKEIEKSGIPLELGKPLENVNSNSIREDWLKAVERSNSDPSGSITSSRAMIESTLKCILKDSNTPFKSGNNTSSLWHCVKNLLFPTFSNEPAEIKKLVGSVSMMIENIKMIRNNFGDAHGRTDEDQTLDPISARFIANLSISVCNFLTEVYGKRKTEILQNAVMVSPTATPK